ncbi:MULTISPECIES: aryl-sulfate sulfotransferase [Bifidobacterium]|uniref:aryl-sulfate sulfotransferase n=1 Tax=Bifidobacterium TaxID=1678 RepID=UPI001BDCFC44|nr:MULTISPECIES: aryl-sulfate sulfotransferase [Bifidobacterium]MBT1160684.1 aryl-sulfate sulfotransferase [Bifidobacterium sp. SO1]MBW3077899.1 aryl-sulfate sulfotransferase [Bifidobacterium simiiventris]
MKNVIRLNPTVRTNVIRGVAATVAVIVTVVLCLLTQDNVSATIKQNRIERLNAQIANVYTADYQQMADENLAKARDKETHDVDNIFVADNPYGTNTTSLYVYFNSRYETAVTYTVSAAGYPDFTATANQGEDYTTEHEFLVLGLIPDVENTITFTLTDSGGVSTEYTITHQGPSLLGTEAVRLEQTDGSLEPTAAFTSAGSSSTAAASAITQQLGNGLYAILGNDSDEQDFMYYYDAYGVLRGEVPVKYYRSHRLLFDDDGLMWFSASTHTMVGMNRLGKLEKIYDLGGDFILHHDYALDSDGNIVLLATDLSRDDHAVQDQVVKLDTDTGKTTLLLDFGTMFADYKSTTDHSGIDESDPTATNRWDWLHCNTIQLLPDGSALFSARETSTIIKVNDLEGTPTLAYMIGEQSVWDGTEYADLFLTKDGDFGDTGGQHSITYVADDSLADVQYYLYMFDNNYGYAMTRPDYDWTVIDGISTAGSSKDKDSRSQYRRYLVDENAGTYAEVASFDVPYSPYVSSAQELGNGNILIDTGMQGLFGTYTADGELLAQYRMELNTAYIYRVYQYSFKGFYFA